MFREYMGVDEEPPIYGKDVLEMRFRLPRPVFHRLLRANRSEPACSRIFKETGLPQAHAVHTVSAAMRVLGYAEPVDRAE